MRSVRKNLGVGDAEIARPRRARAMHAARMAWPENCRPRYKLPIDDFRVDERYAAVIECAGRQYFFSRREVLDVDDAWETAVRTADGAWENAARTARRTPYSAATITLGRDVNMSHNAAVECVDGRLVVYGGQGYLNSTTQHGIFVREAPASPLPLQWSAPQLSISGDPAASGCIEERTPVRAPLRSAHPPPIKID